jgi:hypothetical protein
MRRFVIVAAMVGTLALCVSTLAKAQKGGADS